MKIPALAILAVACLLTAPVASASADSTRTVLVSAAAPKAGKAKPAKKHVKHKNKKQGAKHRHTVKP